MKQREIKSAITRKTKEKIEMVVKSRLFMKEILISKFCLLGKVKNQDSYLPKATTLPHTEVF